MATLQNIYDTLSDFIIDNTPGTVDVQSEGLRAVNYLLNDIQSRHDWDFSKKEYTLRYYDGVHDYALPSDYKILSSVAPAFSSFDDFRMVSPTVFKRYVASGASGNLVAVDRGIRKGLKLNYRRSGPNAIISIVEPNNAYDENGTWTSSLGAVNIHTDDIVYYSPTGFVGNVAFDTEGDGVVFLRKQSIPEPFDYTSYLGGKLFQWFYFPTAAISSVTLTLGAATTDKYDMSVTTQYDGNPFVVGWNFLGFDLETADVIGTPGNLASYLSVTILVTEDAPFKNWRFSEVFASNYIDLLVRYYTTLSVRDAVSGELRSTFEGDDSNDELIFPDEFMGVLQAGAAWLLLRQTLEAEEAERYRLMYEQKLSEFKDRYPSTNKKAEPPAMTIGLNPWF